MRLVSSGFAFAFALAMFTTTSDASAAGAALDASELSAKARLELKAEIDKAHADVPDLVRQVQDVAMRAKDIDSTARVPGMPLTMPLKALGPRALFPMIELLAFDAHTPADLTPTAARALRLGLIEAIGAIRDPRAIPVMATLLEKNRDADTARASSEALARIGTDEAVSTLIDAAKKARAIDGTRERAILSGMHDCRRAAAARFLASRLDEQPDAETARVLAKALGGVGNAWAWKTLSSQAEAPAVRGAAARALVNAYVRYNGDVREAAAKALLVIDEPSTGNLVAKAKSGASRDAAAALDELDRRLANNPSR